MPNAFMGSGQPTRPFNPAPTTRVGSGRGSVAIPAPVPAAKAPAPAPSPTSGMTVQNVDPNAMPKDFMSEIYRRGNIFGAPEGQISAAAQQILPMYQARLGGLQGPTSDAMRLNAQQDIQSQYGNALRQAQQIAGNQGIRGPAAAAMQNDIRNQMGMAQAKYSRDLTVADWDAKRQALADYYGAMGTERGVSIGNLGALQQLQNTQTGFGAYEKALAAQLAAANQRGPAGDPMGGAYPMQNALNQFPGYQYSPFGMADQARAGVM